MGARLKRSSWFCLHRFNKKTWLVRTVFHAILWLALCLGLFVHIHTGIPWRHVQLHMFNEIQEAGAWMSWRKSWQKSSPLELCVFNLVDILKTRTASRKTRLVNPKNENEAILASSILQNVGHFPFPFSLTCRRSADSCTFCLINRPLS